MSRIIMSVVLAVILLAASGHQAAARTYCPIEIWDLVVEPHLTKSELIDLLGPPDFVGTFTNEYYNGLLWQYYGLTADCAGDGAVYNQNFLFENDRVVYGWVQSIRRVNLYLPLVVA